MKYSKLAFLTSLLMMACSVGPDYKQEKLFSDDEISKSLNLQTPFPNQKNFMIVDFGDDVLNQLIKDAEISSPNLKMAILKLRQAREVLKIDVKNGFPTFDISAKYNYVNESDNMETLVKNDYYQIGVDMAWEIDIFGKTRREAESSKAQYRAMVENLKNVNVSLISDIATNYINLRMAEQNLKNMRENILLQEDVYNIILERFNADLVDEMTLSQSKYLLENMKMQVPMLEYQREMYANALAVLLGKLPQSLDEFLQSENKNLVSRVFEYDVEKLYRLPVSIIRSRPDVRMAEENLISQNAEIGVAVANVYPSFSLSGFLGFQSLKFSNLIERDSVGHSLIPEMVLPLFHFSQLRNNIEVQKLKRDEAEVNYEQTLLNAVAELRNAIVAIDKEYKVNKSASLAYQKMSDVSYLMWKKYLSGLVEYTDVLTAEQNRLEAQTNMVNSNANLYKNIITFYKAIGGKYE